MIAHLRGKLLVKHPNQAVVETAGVGYEVIISVPTFSDLPTSGSEVALHIHTHVREDVIALYGFLRPSEKLLFEKLISVSGIGPKLAITILSGMAADEMVSAIRSNNVAQLTRVPGIGKKTAERMVLELRDKLPETAQSAVPSPPSMSAVEEDVLSALINLGYQRPAAENILAGPVERDRVGDLAVPRVRGHLGDRGLDGQSERDGAGAVHRHRMQNQHGAVAEPDRDVGDIGLHRPDLGLHRAGGHRDEGHRAQAVRGAERRYDLL